MIPLTLAEVAAAVGGTVVGADPDAVVTGPVVADSRQVRPGGLFVALPGENVDGHDFAAAAVAAGAVAVLAERPVPGVPAVTCEDALTAIGRLAREVVSRHPRLTVVGVTGSSGKTSTKDLLRALLSRLGPTVAPQGSFNNELGAPLTALTVDEATRYLVVEMGARHPGNIAYLCGITPPDVAVVLNVGSAHLGEFGDRSVTAATKGELVEALTPQGVAVLNADDPLVAAMSTRTVGRVLLAGRSRQAEVRADDVVLDGLARASFTLTTPAGSVRVGLALSGEHHVANALSAAAVAWHLGLPLEALAEALGEATAASRWRMEVTDRSDGVTVVNDAYNANPESVRAGLAALVAMAGSTRRSVAVLGEMGELGPGALDEHRSVGVAAARRGVDVVLGVGAGPTRELVEAAREAGVAQARWVPDRDAAVATLRGLLSPGDVVLVKGSRAFGLEQVAAAVLADVAEEHVQ